jgi:hypothetical protein
LVLLVFALYSLNGYLMFGLWLEYQESGCEGLGGFFCECLGKMPVPRMTARSQPEMGLLHPGVSNSNSKIGMLACFAQKLPYFIFCLSFVVDVR